MSALTTEDFGSEEAFAEFVRDLRSGRFSGPRHAWLDSPEGRRARNEVAEDIARFCVEELGVDLSQGGRPEAPAVPLTGEELLAEVVGSDISDEERARLRAALLHQEVPTFAASQKTGWDAKITRRTDLGDIASLRVTNGADGFDVAITARTDMGDIKTLKITPIART